MKDPHIHVENEFALVLMTGGILSYGKTHHTGCDRRRPARQVLRRPAEGHLHCVPRARGEGASRTGNGR